MMCLTIVSFGQERFNRTKILFDQNSEKLESAVGWSYNSKFGEWIDYQNVISDRKEYKTLPIMENKKIYKSTKEYSKKYNKLNINVQLNRELIEKIKELIKEQDIP